MKEIKLAVSKVPVNFVEKEDLPLIKLEKENHRLREKNFRLEQENKELKKQLAEKDKEIEELKAKLEQSIGMKIMMICNHKKDIQTIRKQVCDEIRQFIEDHSKYEESIYNYVLIIPTMEFQDFIDKIEKES